MPTLLPTTSRGGHELAASRFHFLARSCLLCDRSRIRFVWPQLVFVRFVWPQLVFVRFVWCFFAPGVGVVAAAVAASTAGRGTTRQSEATLHLRS